MNNLLRILKKYGFLLVSVFLLVVVGLASEVKEAKANTLTVGSLALSDSRPSNVGTTYSSTFSNVDNVSTVKCVKLFFSNMATGGTAPTGIGVTGATVVAASNFVTGISSWTVAAAPEGTVKISNVTGGVPSSASSRTLNLAGITNGSVADTSYFLQFSTYGNTDCATTPLDSVIVKFIYTSGQAVSLTIDPTLTFTLAAVAIGQSVNGQAVSALSTTSTIPFGTLTASANATAAHDATVTTNAGSGYTVYIKYTQKPTSGANTIADHAGTNGTPTTFPTAGSLAAFGYTTNDSSLSVTGDGAARFTATGGNKWAAFTALNTEVAYSAAAVTSDVTRVGYQASILGTTPAGTYTTTVVLTATPTY